MEWPRIVQHEIYIYLLYVCYNSENKHHHNQQQHHYHHHHHHQQLYLSKEIHQFGRITKRES